jgi:hypothetical protein
MHPLVDYHEDRSERERVGFLNRTVEASRLARGGEVRRCDYLDHATGDLIGEVDARAELTELLARLRGRLTTSADVERVIQESQAGSGEAVPTAPLATGAVIGATVEKRREKGRVVEILTRVVFGTMAGVQAALAKSKVSRRINTSFLRRQNATDRHHNARKVRKTYTF